MGDVLQQHGFTGARRRNDQATLAFTDWSHKVDDARRTVLGGRIIGFHLQPFFRVQRRQVVKVDLVTRALRIVEVDPGDFGHAEIPLVLARGLNDAFDSVARAQRELAQDFRRDVNVIRARQVVRGG
ncbi:hypothetical protein GALL_495030 [mine drainage metagenome]|uniref:Uncharacterized protein n=1 Tax=mine drainage metagenome TaxID=410659 RepID=A0A1J5PB69_9ZZZZ